ncbi:MAG: bifunctional metallophosphatase/5'-nucleotidase [Chlamydiae bacterium]|nr:bifunctional metallophosphatase/5'-nucleotidase [Chlamydiota bacterium]
MSFFRNTISKVCTLSLSCISLACCFSLDAKNVTFTILSFNDVYEIEPDKDGRGGFAGMQTLLNHERANSAHHITTVNGDFLSPCLLSIFDKGAHRIELFNMLGIDMVVLGNHEFDFGPGEVKKRIAESNFPWLTANAFGVDGKYFTGDKQTVIVDADGIKIGFFGLITVETPELSSTEKKVCFSPLAFTARKMIKELKDQGADVIVALTHLLMHEDRQLAKEVPEIDVILGGHDHDPITWYDDKTFIHKSGQNAYYLARIDLIVEKDDISGKTKVFPSWNVIINKDIPQDPAVAHVVGGYIKTLDEVTSEQLAVTSVEMNTLYSSVRTQDNIMGNIVADALRIACDADLSIISGGIIRGNKIYKPGYNITMKDLFVEMPFGNVNVCVEISGRNILDALENGVSQFEGKAGRFPQISGVSFAFDESMPVGERIKSVIVGDQPLDLDKIYKVATVDYMLNGGDGYSMFKSGKILIAPQKQITTISSVADYLRERRELTNQLENRIVSVTSVLSLDDLAPIP